nr:putative reverse transcriptase domain-containing protein [Tanacetum cinerariifolium]
MTIDNEGNLKIRPLITAEEHQQNAIKARFGGNVESKKMQKSLLKQKFEEFKIFKEEGLDKGYDKMQKILTQMNTLKIKPDPEDIKMKFLRDLPSSWSGIALILKTKGGLEYISFDDLYNKLKFLEIDTKEYSSSSPTLSNDAFVSTAGSSQGNLSYQESGNGGYGGYTTTLSASPGFSSSKGSSKSKCSVVDDVIYSFFANHEIDQQLIYEDLDQMNKDEFEEENALFDKKLVKCFNCKQMGHFSRECRAQGVQNNNNYQKYKSKKVGKDGFDSKTMVVVDGSIDWDKQTKKGNIDPRSLENFGMLAGIKLESDADSEGEVVSADDVIPVAVSVSVGPVDATTVSPHSETEFAIIGLSTEAKWTNSGKNLYKLIDNSMSVRTKRGLGLDKYIREGGLGIDDSVFSIFYTISDDLEGQPIYNRFASVGHIKAVPPPLTGNYMPPSNIPDIDESQMVYGTTTTDSSEIKTNDDIYKVEGFTDSKTIEHIAKAGIMVVFVPSEAYDIFTKDDLPLHKIDCDLHEQRLVKRNAEGKGKLGRRPTGKPVNPNRPNPVSTGQQNTISAGLTYPVTASQPNPVSAGQQNIVSASSPNPVYAGHPNPVSAGWPWTKSSMSTTKGSKINGESKSKSWSFAKGPLGRPKIEKEKDRGIVDSGCSRRKGTIKTKNLNFENVLYVEELQHFNLILVSQICYQTHMVLFTETECLVLSKDFPLPDPSMVILSIPRKHNLYTFSLNDLALQGPLTCLIAKASQNESTLWHRRLGHVNFRTMNKLTEAVATACYVLNRVLVTKAHAKTPYELLTRDKPSISYLKPFGCHVTILNTSESLTKFDKKSDEGYIVGYSISGKAYRVYNLVSRKIEETMNLIFLENKPFVAGTGQAWMFDIDYLTDFINYSRVSSTNLTAGSSSEKPANVGSQEDKSDLDDEPDVLIIHSTPTPEVPIVDEASIQHDGKEEADRLGLAFPSLNPILGVGSISIGSSISAGSTPPVSTGSTPSLSPCASPISADCHSISAGQSPVLAARPPVFAGRSTSASRPANFAARTPVLMWPRKFQTNLFVRLPQFPLLPQVLMKLQNKTLGDGFVTIAFFDGALLAPIRALFICQSLQFCWSQTSHTKSSDEILKPFYRKGFSKQTLEDMLCAFVLDFRKGTIAYRLELPEKLSKVHSMFHVSKLKKCLVDEPLAIPLDEIQVDDKLHFIEEPVEIMDREVKRLKQSHILIVKVRWNSRIGPEFTWEREDQMQKKYPHLFTNSAPAVEVAS